MTQDTLEEGFAALQAQREREWPAAQVQANADARAALVAAYDPHDHAQPGEVVEDFALTLEGGATLRRDTLIARGPAVLIFFRFGGCPACNVALPRYDRVLVPALARADIPLVAISPETPVDPTLRARHGLRLLLASDPHNALGDALGITFAPETPPAATGTARLPQPTALILERDASVRFLSVSPDWLTRPEPEAILAQLSETGVQAAAA